MGAMLRLQGSGEYETCRSGSAAVCIARARFRWRRRHQLWRAGVLVWDMQSEQTRITVRTEYGQECTTQQYNGV